MLTTYARRLTYKDGTIENDELKAYHIHDIMRFGFEYMQFNRQVKLFEVFDENGKCVFSVSN